MTGACTSAQNWEEYAMVAKKRESVRMRRALLVVEIPAVVATLLAAVHVTVNALLRTLFNISIPSTAEYIQYLYLPALALLGIIAAQQRGEHITADLLYRTFPRTTRRFVTAIISLTCAIVCLGFAWYGLEEAIHAYEVKMVAGVTTVQSWPIYFLVPVVFLFMAFSFGAAAYRALRAADAVEDSDDVDAAEAREFISNLEESA